MVTIFMPGLLLCLLLAAAMSLVVAGMIDMVYRWITNSPLYDKCSILILLAGVYGAILILWQGRKFFKKPVTACHAVRIERDAAPELFKVLNEVCEKLSSPIPDNVLIAFSPNFFVTEAKTIAFDGKYEGRTLCLSAPLMNFLGEDELKAVIAHELAHFTGEDTVYSREFYPIYEVTMSALHKMDAEEGLLMEFLFYLPRVYLSGFLRFFSGIERRIGREREFRADSIAASIASPDQMSSALVIASVYGRVWDKALEQIFTGLLQEGRRPVNYLRVFAKTIINDPCVAEFGQAALSQEPGGYDSHPTLKERLDKLGRECPPLPRDALNKPAISMLREREAIEERLTRFEMSLFKAV